MDRDADNNHIVNISTNILQIHTRTYRGEGSGDGGDIFPISSRDSHKQTDDKFDVLNSSQTKQLRNRNIQNHKSIRIANGKQD